MVLSFLICKYSMLSPTVGVGTTRRGELDYRVEAVTETQLMERRAAGKREPAKAGTPYGKGKPLATNTLASASIEIIDPAPASQKYYRASMQP